MYIYGLTRWKYTPSLCYHNFLTSANFAPFWHFWKLENILRGLLIVSSRTTDYFRSYGCLKNTDQICFSWKIWHFLKTASTLRFNKRVGKCRFWFIGLKMVIEIRGLTFKDEHTTPPLSYQNLTSAVFTHPTSCHFWKLENILRRLVLVSSPATDYFGRYGCLKNTEPNCFSGKICHFLKTASTLRFNKREGKCRFWFKGLKMFMEIRVLTFKDKISRNKFFTYTVNL